MVDENGANKNVIRQVLGDEMAKKKLGVPMALFLMCQTSEHEN